MSANEDGAQGAGIPIRFTPPAGMLPTAAGSSRRATRWAQRSAATPWWRSDGFSARYDLDRIAGIFSRPAHKLAGQSYVGRILVLDTAKGGVASAWMLHEMQSRDKAPLAIVFNSVNPILAQGAALRRHHDACRLRRGRDASRYLTAATVEIDPESKSLKVL